MNYMDDELLQKHLDAARNSTLNEVQFYVEQNRDGFIDSIAYYRLRDAVDHLRPKST